MSDHNSGPRALADPVVDITDVYAFPSPAQPGVLVLVLNVFPSAEPAALFSDAVDYRFRLRPVTIGRETAAAFTVGEQEYIVSCRFAGPVELQAARRSRRKAPAPAAAHPWEASGGVGLLSHRDSDAAPVSVISNLTIH